jgi:dTMP kinase
MKLIVIEGLDGSGKSTQAEMLRKYIEIIGNPVHQLHFPRADGPFYGEMINRFLRGELGSISQVDPYLVALLYAGDRAGAVNILKEWEEEDAYVILDRYVYSNIAFQCAKLSAWNEREKLANWILDLEFQYHAIPQPVVNLFLDVPFEFTKQKLQEKRAGSNRDYLNGAEDIHEKDLEFQQQVREVYLWLAQHQNANLKVIKCASDEGKMYSKLRVFDQISSLLFPV